MRRRRRGVSCSRDSDFGSRARRHRSAYGRVVKRAGYAIVMVSLVAAVLAPWLSPNEPDTQFPGLLDAPPTAIRIRDGDGVWRRPFFYRQRLVNQLEQSYEED